MSGFRQRRGPASDRKNVWEVDSGEISRELINAFPLLSPQPPPPPSPPLPRIRQSQPQPPQQQKSTIPINKPNQFYSSTTRSLSNAVLTNPGVSWNMAAKHFDNGMHGRYMSSTNYYHQQPSLFMRGGSGNALISGRNLSPFTPTIVPDSAYRAHVSGRGNLRENSFESTKIKMAQLFGVFSVIGFIFLTLVGMLIDTQPMFLQGVITKHVRNTSGKSQNFYATDIKVRLKPASHSYWAAMLYLLCAVLCLGYANNINWFLIRKRLQQYRDIDDGGANPSISTFQTGFGGGVAYTDEFLPGMVHHQHAYGDQNGHVARIWHKTSMFAQRAVIYLSSIWHGGNRSRRRFAVAKDV